MVKVSICLSRLLLCEVSEGFLRYEARAVVAVSTGCECSDHTQPGGYARFSVTIEVLTGRLHRNTVSASNAALLQFTSAFKLVRNNSVATMRRNATKKDNCSSYV